MGKDIHRDGRTEILLAEDEAAIREGLAVLLEGENYAVRVAADGEEAVSLFSSRRPDLVLLDVMMPRKNGYAACAEIRARDAAVPILFLTAKGGDAEELRGLSLGADDFVAKTSSPQVLLARIARVLQRIRAVREDEPGGDFDFAGWRVDTARLRLVSATGPGPELSVREVELMRLLVRHPGEVFSREALLARFWGASFDGNEAALSTAISRLRGKLGAGAACLEAVWGCGYRYRR